MKKSQTRIFFCKAFPVYTSEYRTVFSACQKNKKKRPNGFFLGGGVFIERFLRFVYQSKNLKSETKNSGRRFNYGIGQSHI